MAATVAFCVCLFAIFSASSTATVATRSFAAGIGSPIRILRSSEQSLAVGNGGEAKKTAAYETKYFAQTLDHFSYRPESNATFQQRYLINATYWGGAGHPIFLYTGNEGKIEWFAENTGFMFDAAPSFRALLVFVEHRYYGESIPFGGEKEAFKSASTAGYLSSAQVLADYATFIVDLQKNLSAEHSPVVLFGGSYGGMLAAWFRMKYPHLAVGALASSAPLLLFEDNYSPYIFANIVTNNFKEESECCYKTIKDAWQELTVYYNMSDGLPKFQKAYNICEDEEEVETLITNAFVSASMVDYPTAADFMALLPAYPIKKMCEAIDNHRGNDSLSKVFAALNVYYNYSGTIKCFRNPPRNSHGSDPGWSWQSCTEFFVPQGFDEHSMFPITTPNLTLISEDCLNNTGVTRRPNWITTEFSIKGMKNSLKRFASNIIFFNGLRDPWSGAGILESISDSLVTIVAPEGAHHVDLRFSTKEDPKWLQDIRSQELQIISKWLNEYYKDRNEHNIQFDVSTSFP